MKTVSIIFLLFIAVIQPAKADSILLGAYSHHFQKSDKQLNEDNQMFGVEYHGYVAGRMINSFNDETYFAGKRFTIGDMGNFRFAATAGIDYGYKDCNTHRPQPYGADPVVCPLVVAQVLYTKYQIQPSLGVFGRAATLHIEVKF